MKQRQFRTLIITLELTVLLILGVILFYKQFSVSPSYSPIVQLSHGGYVRGVIGTADTTDDLFIYEAIPFGVAERFRKSFLYPGWSSTFDATHPRDACPFLGLEKAEKRYTTHTYSEDCLYATVWLPSKPIKNRLRPVMIYIYGGGFDTGSVFKVNHDGRYIAVRGDVIVVGFNYRIGPFGFLYGGNQTDGNVGLWDMITAFEWVKLNIESFGGNPNQVTLFGNSAGANAIAILIHSPISNRKLFHRVILQSGGPTLLLKKETSNKFAQTLAKNLSCETDTDFNMAKCLREKSIEDIMFATERLEIEFNPIYDDELFPLSFNEAFRQGNFNSQIDIIFGFVKDEGGSWLPGYFPELEPEVIDLTFEQTRYYLAILMKKSGFGDYTNEADELYLGNLNSNSSANELRNALAKMQTNLRFNCPELSMIQRWARNAPFQKYYSYVVTQRPSYHVMGACTKEWMGVCHADELFYLFTIKDQKYESEKRLSWAMIKAWTSFATNSDPGLVTNVKWEEAFTRNPSGEIINFDTRFMRLENGKFEMISEFFKDTCEGFWNDKLLRLF